MRSYRTDLGCEVSDLKNFWRHFQCARNVRGVGFICTVSHGVSGRRHWDFGIKSPVNTF